MKVKDYVEAGRSNEAVISIDDIRHEYEYAVHRYNAAISLNGGHEGSVKAARALTNVEVLIHLSNTYFDGSLGADFERHI